MNDKGQLSALEVGELDLFVDSMEPSEIENIGNQAWIDWHTRLQKLNQQAVLEASSMMEEATKETLISHGKLPVLVHEAICIQVWRLKIYPQMMKLEPAPASTFGIYMVLYHEAAAVGLLETVLFHEDGVQCISEVIIDLLQYATEQLTSLIALLNDGYLKPMSGKEMESETVIEELQRQKRDLQFDISMRCISIVRYLAEHMEAAGSGVSIATNLYKTNDVPSILCHLLQLEPWKKVNDKGDIQIFNYGRWSKSNREDLSQMHRSEAQLWLCLRQLLLEPRLKHFYVIDEVRRTAFCRLQGKMTEEIIDQIPPLGELKSFLCQMAMGDYSSLHNRGNGVKAPGCTVIEVVPQIKNAYLRQVHKRKKSLAANQLKNCFVDGSDESRRMAKKLLESYTSDAALALDSGGAKCAKCGDKANKKCSRCKSEWYCGRECQVQQWPKHRDICDQFAKLHVSV
ncbi:PREDICTED: zinc finger MYND domain-containing protein 10 [Papilio polytes]|uniref:zinc finger MYND domain-containing protein 10 n=1 Tax=Papilio polytes TaxID=76194 RepID=UPI00067668D3|nr:PREDICTED: zinc finger MYND domain-containing protein 10 [Papilio polytes]